LGEISLIFGENVLVFGENLGVFGENVVRFGGKMFYNPLDPFCRNGFGVFGGNLPSSRFWGKSWAVLGEILGFTPNWVVQ
jgi:hypothetical protein